MKDSNIGQSNGVLLKEVFAFHADESFLIEVSPYDDNL